MTTFISFEFESDVHITQLDVVLGMVTEPLPLELEAQQHEARARGRIGCCHPSRGCSISWLDTHSADSSLMGMATIMSLLPANWVAIEIARSSAVGSHCCAPVLICLAIESRLAC